MRNERKWTRAEEYLLTEFVSGHPGGKRIAWRAFAEVLGRTAFSVANKWERMIGLRKKCYAKSARGEYPNSKHRPSEAELAERDRRGLVEPRDLTAEICGDPLPGFSALDRRR